MVRPARCRVALKRYRADPELRRGEVQAWGQKLETAGWRRTEGEAWSLFLARGRPSDRFYSGLRPGQWVNRFPGMAAYAVKSFLAANLAWSAAGVRRRTGSTGGFDFLPETFVLPHGLAAWRARAEEAPEAWWLLKPQASSRGRGIRLLEPTELPPTDGDWLVQRYIDRPHAIDGYKYGLRYYVLVTCLDPLVVYVHRVGTCRAATRPFAMDAVSRADPLVHLINTAIQQESPEVPWWQRNLGLDGYYRRLADEGHDPTRFEQRVHDLLTRTLIACRDQALIESRSVTSNLSGCFEFLGVDIQVDTKLKPWLLECNPAPPMEDEGGFDARAGALFGGIKKALMGDTISLLDAAMDGPYSWPERAAEEIARAGGWQRLYPRSDAGRFLDDFPRLRLGDRALALAVGADLPPEPRLGPADGVAGLPFADGLVLHQASRGRLFATNAMGAYLWAGLAEGAEIEELVEELTAVRPDREKTVLREEIDDLLGVWAQLGLLSGYEVRSESQVGPLRVQGWIVGETLLVPMDPALQALDGQDLASITLPSTQIRRVVFLHVDRVAAADLRSISATAGLDTLALRSAEALRVPRDEARELVGWVEKTVFFETTSPVPESPADAAALWPRLLAAAGCPG